MYFLVSLYFLLLFTDSVLVGEGQVCSQCAKLYMPQQTAIEQHISSSQMVSSRLRLASARYANLAQSHSSKINLTAGNLLQPQQQTGTPCHKGEYNTHISANIYSYLFRRLHGRTCTKLSVLSVCCQLCKFTLQSK